jgi:hypothetical protein
VIYALARRTVVIAGEPAEEISINDYAVADETSNVVEETDRCDDCGFLEIICLVTKLCAHRIARDITTSFVLIALGCIILACSGPLFMVLSQSVSVADSFASTLSRKANSTD